MSLQRISPFTMHNCNATMKKITPCRVKERLRMHVELWSTLLGDRYCGSMIAHPQLEPMEAWFHHYSIKFSFYG